MKIALQQRLERRLSDRREWTDKLADVTRYNGGDTFLTVSLSGELESVPRTIPALVDETLKATDDGAVAGVAIGKTVAIRFEVPAELRDVEDYGERKAWTLKSIEQPAGMFL